MNTKTYRYQSANSAYSYTQVKVKFTTYENGRTAIVLADDRLAIPIAKATINMPEVALLDNEVIVKDYAENDGMLRFLLDNEIVELTGKAAKSGYITSQICRLLVKPEDFE